jgi:hypothetical protein
MKRLAYGCSELLVADRTADLVLDYAVALIMENSVDVVQLTAYLPEAVGAMEFRLLVGAQVPLAARSSDDERPAPDNRTAELRMREQIARLTAQPSYTWTTADLL